MFRLSRIKQHWRRSQFLGAYEAASKSENIHERVAAAEFALGIADRLDPWPDSVGPKERAIGKLHDVLGYAYNELGEIDPQRFSSLALQESLKAVTHLTKTDGVDWARAMTTLSLAYANSPDGHDDDNIERAIETAEAAREILDPEHHREEWLSATFNLAAFYANRRRDSMTTNIEESIRLYQEVQEERSKSGSPLQQARALFGLADCYLERRKYAKEQNIERAIDLLEKGLKLISPKTSPRAWTKGQTSLAVAYWQRIQGEKDENLRRAIAANSECIAVLERTGGARERWAAAKMVRSALLENCQEGERETNLNDAIEAAESALSVFTAEEYPDDHARVAQTINRLRSLQHNDSRSGVLEEIIRNYEATLASLSSESNSDDRASLLVRLGNAYAERVESDRSENMERSLEYLEQAVQLFDQRARPLEWGSAMLSLAQSYNERTKGLRADNIEKSIALCESAVVVVSSLSDPNEHSAILETLGEAFTRRVRGDQRENLEKAIEIFDTAQVRRDREHDPEAWLRLEQKFLQAERILRSITVSERGNDTNSQFDVEQYLEGLHASANMISPKDHPRTWMAAQLFLGDAYTQVTPAGVDIGDAIPFVDAVLANCRKAVSIYEGMLPAAQRLGDQHQQALLRQRIGLAYGLMYVFSETQSNASADPEAQGRFAGQARSYFESSIAAHTATSEINSLERSPREHLKSAVCLGRLHTYEREWAAAEIQFASAADAADRLLGSIELSESDMRDVLRDLHDVATFAPFVSLMLHKPTRAIELFEIGRARILAKALTLESLPLAPEQRDELYARQRELIVHERRLISPRLFDRMTPLQKSIRLRQEIKTLAAGANLADHFSGFTAVALESLVRDDSVVVIPVLSNSGGRIVVCFGRNGKSETCVVECPEGEALRSIFDSRGLKTGGDWKQRYLNHSKQGMFDEDFDAVGAALGEVFATPLVEALESLGIGPGAHLDILPQGPLGILPLGLARDGRSGQLLLDRYEFSLSPSLTALCHARKRAATIPSSVVALANPTRDLRHAELESYLLRNWFQGEHAEYKENCPVTPEEVLKMLPRGEVWHFATHGQFDASAPLESRLSLGDERYLTLEMIFEMRGVGAPRLVVLSACESGLYDLADFPFEFIGLPSGFLHAGAAGVIATLWPVDDLSTALIVARFYEGYLGDKLTPSAALRAAQLWLRDATAADLRQAVESWGRSGRVSSIGKMMDELDQRVIGRASGRDAAPKDSFANRSSANIPFSSPFFWGGFVHYGV